MDRDIFAQLMDLQHMERTRMRDVFPDRPYKVVFLGSMAERRVGSVLVDLNRDGKFEERWTIKPEEVSRLVPEDPATGGQPVKYTLSRGRWQVH
jgi:hypothetical protein